jgi:transposase-like protein
LSGANGTDEAKEKFLDALSECGNISRAAKLAGIPRRTLYNWRDEDEEFQRLWDKAAAYGTDALEDEAIRRAYEGVEKPVYYQGAVCGSVQEYSDSLLALLLKARKPDRFRENSTVKIGGDGEFPIKIDASLSPEEAYKRLIGQ